MSPIFLILLLAVGLEARPDGAPRSACSSMTPSHSGIQAQRSSVPYRVAAIKSGNKVRVTISSPYGEEFEGFMLQARSKDGSRIIDGTFSRSEIAKAVDCNNGRGNTLTQVNANPKSEVQTEWIPAGSVNEEIIFRATVAKTFALFWTRVDSEAVRIMQNGGGYPNREQPQSSESKPESSLSMYDGCYSTKGCFAYPANCINRNDCEVLLSFSKLSNGIRFEMLGYLDDRKYMAMALSTDAVMGDDSVTECFREGSSIVARHSYNEGKSNTRTRELSRERYGGSFTNGLTTCTWTAPFLLQANGKTYDLANNTYYALLAKGSMTNGRLNYHDGRIASSEAINFTALEAVEDAGATASVKIHGTFMCTAWIGFVSLGIILAKAFKNVWEQSTLCGQKVWFALHRAFMLSALTFAVIAFIVIFIHKNGWNYATKNPHAVLGCITMALGVLQPIMALFRPSPDHKRRPIFNWLHFIVGNGAQILAVITIFFAVTLESSGLKSSFYWVMSIFVIVHVIFHFLFQLHMFTTKKKTNDMAMNNMNGSRQEDHQANMTENVFRILLLGIYGIFLLVIMVTIYSLIGVA